jgi:hypothetical protein
LQQITLVHNNQARAQQRRNLNWRTGVAILKYNIESAEQHMIAAFECRLPTAASDCQNRFWMAEQPVDTAMKKGGHLC